MQSLASQSFMVQFSVLLYLSLLEPTQAHLFFPLNISRKNMNVHVAYRRHLNRCISYGAATAM